MIWKSYYDYAAVIRYVFENGEMVEFEQYKTLHDKKEFIVRFQTKEGTYANCWLASNIFDDRKVFSVVGVIRSRLGYPMPKSYIDFHSLEIRIGNFENKIYATPTHCFFKDIATNKPCCPLKLKGENAPTMVHTVGKNEAGSPKVLLRIVVDMLTKHTGQTWREEEFIS